MTQATFHRSLLWLSMLGLLLGLLCLSAVAASAQTAPLKGTPWWATTLTVAGPLADGLSTIYAAHQSGPHAQVIEGNGFYRTLFGADVTTNEIMAFKVGQAAVFGAIVHYAGKQPGGRGKAIAVSLACTALNVAVTTMNVRTAQQAQRLNRR